MTEPDGALELRVPERTVPVPSSISPQARAVLGVGLLPGGDYPAVEDRAAWLQMIALADAALLARFPDGVGEAAVTEAEVGDCTVYQVTPPGASPAESRVCLDIHGGALIMGGGAVCRAMAVGMSRRIGLPLWSPDYRMPPDHSYPAALDDCLAVYRALLETRRPADIVVSGTSAGGNLAAALILRARDEGLPLPSAAVLNTPEVDLTESGDTFQTNLGVDTVLTRRLMPANLLYAGGHDLSDPYLSPLFGDFTKGFPPTLLATGTRDLFLSNTVRMHRALRSAGVPAELHVLEAAPHGGFMGAAPEDLEITREVRRFIDTRCPAAHPAEAARQPA